MNDHKKSELIDKGPCILYWQLSYRRRLIRDLWIIGIGITIFIGLKFFNPNVQFYIFIFPLFGLPQVAYNFYQWKTKEKTPFIRGHQQTIDEINHSHKMKKNLVLEAKFYLSAFFIAIILAVPFVYAHPLYREHLLTSQTYNPSMLLITNDPTQMWFYSIFLMSLPAILITIKFTPKEKFLAVLKSSYKMYGTSTKWSLRILYMCLAFFSLMGLLFQNYAYREYTIFNAKEVIISKAFELEKKKYSYADVKELRWVKFFKAPSGKRIMRPHFVITFNDGERWLSRENFESDDKTSEENLLKFLLNLTQLELKESRYYDEE